MRGTRVDGFRTECDVGVLSADSAFDVPVPFVPVIEPQPYKHFSFCVAHGLQWEVGGVVVMRELGIIERGFL